MPMRFCVGHIVLIIWDLNIRQVGLKVVTYGPGETCILIHILLGVVSITHHSTPFAKVVDTFDYTPARKCFIDYDFHFLVLFTKCIFY